MSPVKVTIVSSEVDGDNDGGRQHTDHRQVQQQVTLERDVL